jgi:hypothetical protein
LRAGVGNRRRSLAVEVLAVAPVDHRVELLRLRMAVGEYQVDIAVIVEVPAVDQLDPAGGGDVHVRPAVLEGSLAKFAEAFLNPGVGIRRTGDAWRGGGILLPERARRRDPDGKARCNDDETFD